MGPVRNGVFRNWGRNQRAVPASLAAPATVEEVATVVRRAVAEGQRVKVIGAGHSFTDIACTDGVLVDIGAIAGIRHVDRTRRQVTVGAGTRLADLNTSLRSLGLALPNLGDIDRQTLAGAIATGTHGTGASYSSISAAVVGARLITGDGAVFECSSTIRPDLIPAIQVNLGALGVVCELTLQCVEAFDLHAVETTEPIDAITERFDDLTGTNDHVEFYWFPHTTVGALKVDNRTGEPIRPRPRVEAFLDGEVVSNALFGALCHAGHRLPRLIEPAIRRAVRPGRSADYVAPSHEVFCSARRVRFVEMEYAIAREDLLEAFDRVRDLVARLGAPVSFPIEVRVLGPDDTLLGTAAGRDVGYIAVHMFHRSPHAAYFDAVEAIMGDYAARPHWGKMHGLGATELATRYPCWSRFAAVRDELDPGRVFTNPYLERVLGS